MRKRTIRLSEELVDQIREQGKKRGFATASAFMRAAIERNFPARRRRLMVQRSVSRLQLTVLQENCAD